MSPEIANFNVPYIWADCPIPCSHSAALPMEVLLRRAGAHVTTEKLCRSLRCTVCGHKGATITIPTQARYDQPLTMPPDDRIPSWAKTPPTWKT